MNAFSYALPLKPFYMISYFFLRVFYVQQYDNSSEDDNDETLLLIINDYDDDNDTEDVFKPNTLLYMTESQSVCDVLSSLGSAWFNQRNEVPWSMVSNNLVQ